MKNLNNRLKKVFQILLNRQKNHKNNKMHILNKNINKIIKIFRIKIFKNLQMRIEKLFI